MYNILIDMDVCTKAYRTPEGSVIWRRIKKLQPMELWDGRPAWWNGDKVPLVLKDEVHEWFVDHNIAYTLNWRWDHKQLIQGHDTPVNFRWEVDIEDPRDAMLVKLRWAL